MTSQIQPPISNISVYFETYTKFFCSVIFEGVINFFSPAGKNIQSITVNGKDIIASNVKFGIADQTKLQKSTKFRIQILLENDEFPETIEFAFNIENSGSIRAQWSPPKDHHPVKLTEKFRNHLKTNHCRSLLDIGGRARSELLRSEEFSNLDVEVLDIIPGDGVTTVCDAHKMSEVLESAKFDAVCSFFVFEHLVMPWKVAIEMNRVMKTGAQAFIITHQTVGMHDMPWDFFRFSDSAWKALFNRHTGFEIIETELQSPNYIIPFRWNPNYADAEKACGFEYSAVLVKKTADAMIDWPLQASDVTNDFYPLGEDNSISKLKI